MSDTPLSSPSPARQSPTLRLPVRFGRYRLTKLIAVGGMAQIYLAKSFGAEGFVKSLVVKRLNPRLAAKTQFTDLFVNEAKLLVTLHHGNVVPVFDFGRVGEDLYMAMEHVPGLTLGRLIGELDDAGEHLGPELSAYIAAEICRGLDYAHRKTDASGRPAGIVHRDIKPSNVLISTEGEVKIVDFGVAKLAGRLEQDEPLAGTIAYMSPEQAGQQQIDARTDLFSTGLVLHEMLTGQRVYGTDSAWETLKLARGAEVPPLPTEVPAELRVIVERATHRDPRERFESAHEMDQDLSSFLLLHRSVLETLDARSPRFQLGEFVRRIGSAGEGGGVAEDSDEELDLEAARAGAVVEDQRTTGSSWTSSPPSAEEPDLAMIQGAAETFHSEFLTRVLRQSAPAARHGRRWIVVVVGLLGIAGLLAVLAYREVPFAHWPGKAEPRRSVTVASTKDKPRHEPGSSSKPGAVESSPKAPPPVRRRRGKRPGRRFGYLNLNAVPWARVTIDGKRLLDPTPLLKLRLSTGHHRVELVNPELGLRKTIRVRIRPGATTWKVVHLR